MSRRKPQPPPERHPNSTMVGLVEVHGKYVVEGAYVMVYAANGKSRGTQTGRTVADDVARRILFELNSSFRQPGSPSEDAR